MHTCACVTQDDCQSERTAAETHTVMSQMRGTLDLLGSSKYFCKV